MASLPQKREATDHSAFLFLANPDILGLFSSSSVKINHFDIPRQRKRLLIFHLRDISVCFPSMEHSATTPGAPRPLGEILQPPPPSCPHAIPPSQRGFIVVPAPEQAPHKQTSPSLSGNRGPEELFIWSRESMVVWIWQTVLLKG